MDSQLIYTSEEQPSNERKRKKKKETTLLIDSMIIENPMLLGFILGLNLSDTEN